MSVFIWKYRNYRNVVLLFIFYFSFFTFLIENCYVRYSLLPCMWVDQIFCSISNTCLLLSWYLEILMTRSFRSELFNYGKRVMTFIRSALIGARARAWLGLKRLKQMHPKTFTTGNSPLSHLVPLLQRNVRRIRLTCMHERERGRERQRGKEKIVLLLPLRGSVLRALFYGVVSLDGIVSPSSHTYAHTYRRCVGTQTYGMHK